MVWLLEALFVCSVVYLDLEGNVVDASACSGYVVLVLVDLLPTPLLRRKCLVLYRSAIVAFPLLFCIVQFFFAQWDFIIDCLLHGCRPWGCNWAAVLHVLSGLFQCSLVPV